MHTKIKVLPWLVIDKEQEFAAFCSSPFKIIGLQELMLDFLLIWLIINNFWNEILEKNFRKTLLWFKMYVILFSVLKNIGNQ